MLTDAEQSASPEWEVLGPIGAPWVVVTHGLGLDAQNMLPLAQQLSDEWRVLLWDMPGHGRSSPAEHWTMDALADALENIMDIAEVENPVMLGFSFGGVVSQYVAARRPDRIRGMVAYGCYAPFHQRPVISPLLAKLIIASYKLQTWAQIQNRFATSCATTVGGRAEVLRAVGGTSKFVFIEMVRSLLGSFRPNAHLTFDFPILCLRGSEEPQAVVNAAQALLQAHPQAREVVIANASHCAHDDNCPDVMTAVTTFLSDVFGRRTIE